MGCCGLCGTIHNLFAFSSCCVDTDGSVFLYLFLILSRVGCCGLCGTIHNLFETAVVLIPLRGQAADNNNNHWNYTFKVGWDVVVGYVGQYTTCLLSAPVVLIPLRGQSSFLFLILWMDVWDSLWFQAFKVGWDIVLDNMRQLMISSCR